MWILYGLKNCDSCRKAMAWLSQHGRAYRFHDLRADGLDALLLAGWVDQLGWERLLNRKSTTWRGLTQADTHDLNRDTALALMLTYPTLIKRPILVADDRLLLGFSPERYAELP